MLWCGEQNKIRVVGVITVSNDSKPNTNRNKSLNVTIEYRLFNYMRINFNIALATVIQGGKREQAVRPVR